MTPIPLPTKGSGIPGDPALLEQGWERRHLADTKRAAEAAELYASLGFEVRSEPLTPEGMGEGCGDCASVVCNSYVLVYTRRPEAPEEP
ncbi:MAG: hypothetical protein GY898_26415 [Proteobacteria bacterium]|nr:hypothetical protein [Pseudomonadota bacterium]